MHVLRGYADRTLPPEVLRRVKVGFSTSATIFMAPEVRAQVRERILAPPFLDLTGFARDHVIELLAAGEAGHEGFARVLSLFSSQLADGDLRRSQ